MEQQIALRRSREAGVTDAAVDPGEAFAFNGDWVAEAGTAVVGYGVGADGKRGAGAGGCGGVGLAGFLI